LRNGKDHFVHQYGTFHIVINIYILLYREMAEYEKRKRAEAAKAMSNDDDGYVPAFFSSGTVTKDIEKEKERKREKPVSTIKIIIYFHTKRQRRAVSQNGDEETERRGRNEGADESQESDGPGQGHARGHAETGMKYIHSSRAE
jgi:hypothetical protein